MSRFNTGSLLYYLFVFVAIFLVFHFLGIIFLIIRGIFFVVIRFWYVFLILGMVWYFTKKRKKKEEKIYRVEDGDDDKTIEIDDYEVH